jgi:hypothetical protein
MFVLPSDLHFDGGHIASQRQGVVAFAQTRPDYGILLKSHISPGVCARAKIAVTDRLP